MASVIVVGGGLAGMAATAALASAGYQVDLFESRPYLGGRATSYPVPSGDGSVETIDNCQHILLRAASIYSISTLGSAFSTRYISTKNSISSNRADEHRYSVLDGFPKPLHFLESFVGMHYLSVSEKIALIRGPFEPAERL